MQTGVESIGEIGLYDIYEIILMAAESLSLISDDFVLEVSHLGLLSSLLDNICQNANFKSEAIKYISDKNALLEALAHDKKGASGGKISAVILKDIGKFEFVKLTPEELIERLG